VFPSWNRRGDGVVAHTNCFAELTTPAAPSKEASRHFLMARPPLLSQEGNTLAWCYAPTGRIYYWIHIIRIS